MENLQEKPTKLDDHPLIPEADFHKRLKAIFSVPKSELDEHIRANPDPPQKRGRKPKPKAAGSPNPKPINRKKWADRTRAR